MAVTIVSKPPSNTKVLTDTQVKENTFNEAWARFLFNLWAHASGLFLNNLINAANDGAAAAAGVPIGAFYRNGSVLMIRVA
jgi:hypothetical protein